MSEIRNVSYWDFYGITDEDGLDSLKRKISEIENEMNNADIDNKIEKLREARNRQIIWVKNYEDELSALRLEVENVQEIRNSLPDDSKCWKRIRLEP